MNIPILLQSSIIDDKGSQLDQCECVYVCVCVCTLVIDVMPVSFMYFPNPVIVRRFNQLYNLSWCGGLGYFSGMLHSTIEHGKTPARARLEEILKKIGV